MLLFCPMSYDMYRISAADASKKDANPVGDRNAYEADLASKLKSLKTVAGFSSLRLSAEKGL